LALARANGESVARNSGDSRNSGSTGEGSGNSINAASGSAGPTPGALSWVAPTGAPFTAGNSGVEGRIAASPGTPEFAPQLAAHVSTFVRDGLQTARLELNPAEMGPLTVQIQLDGNAARVHLAAENAQTRQALEQAMPQLAGNLRESGLTLSGGGVFEQPRQPQQQAQQGAGGNADERGSRDSRNAALGTTAGSSAAPGSMAAPGARRTAGMVDLVA
jgi:flagellar hook-length control protein FliK